MPDLATENYCFQMAQGYYTSKSFTNGGVDTKIKRASPFYIDTFHNNVAYVVCIST